MSEANDNGGEGDLCAAIADEDDDDDDDDDDDNHDARTGSRDAPRTEAMAAHQTCPGILDQISAMAVRMIFRYPGNGWGHSMDTDATAVLD